MTSEIITDWKLFCEGKSSFEKYHFHTLFWEGISESELRQIFEYFPNSDELFNRMNEYLFGNSSSLSPITGDLDLAALVKHDIREKTNFLALFSQNFSYIINAPIEFVKDVRILESEKMNRFHGEFISEMEFQLGEKWIIQDKKAFALYEAIYGLVRYYEMEWYLFAPLIDVDVNFAYYYYLKQYGSDYAITKDRLLVLKNETF